MKTIIENKNFDLTTRKNDWLWFRSFKNNFEILFGIGNQILCLDVHKTFIEVRILFIGFKFWTNT